MTPNEEFTIISHSLGSLRQCRIYMSNSSMTITTIIISITISGSLLFPLYITLCDQAQLWLTLKTGYDWWKLEAKVRPQFELPAPRFGGRRHTCTELRVLGGSGFRVSDLGFRA